MTVSQIRARSGKTPTPSELYPSQRTRAQTCSSRRFSRCFRLLSRRRRCPSQIVSEGVGRLGSRLGVTIGEIGARRLDDWGTIGTIGVRTHHLSHRPASAGLIRWREDRASIFRSLAPRFVDAQGDRRCARDVAEPGAERTAAVRRYEQSDAMLDRATRRGAM